MWVCVNLKWYGGRKKERYCVPNDSTIIQRAARESIVEFLTASLEWIATSQVNGTMAQVLRTTDGGQSWQQSTIRATFLRQITFVDSQHGWLLFAWRAKGGPAEAVSVFRTSDGGQHWAKLSPDSNFKQITYLSFVSSTTGWAIGRHSNTSSFLLKTTDGGKTWASIPSLDSALDHDRNRNMLNLL